MDDILVIIISQTAREFLVVHLWLVFPHAPPPGHLVRVRQFKLPAVPGPGDEVLTSLVCEELQQELPQLDGAGALEPGQKLGRVVGGRLVEAARLLLLNLEDGGVKSAEEPASALRLCRRGQRLRGRGEEG